MSKVLIIAEDEFPLKIPGFGIVGDFGCSKDYAGEYPRDGKIYHLHISFEEMTPLSATVYGCPVRKMIIYEAESNDEIVDTFIGDAELNKIAFDPKDLF